MKRMGSCVTFGGFGGRPPPPPPPPPLAKLGSRGASGSKGESEQAAAESSATRPANRVTAGWRYMRRRGNACEWLWLGGRYNASRRIQAQLIPPSLTSARRRAVSLLSRANLSRSRLKRLARRPLELTQVSLDDGCQLFPPAGERG